MEPSDRGTLSPKGKETHYYELRGEGFQLGGGGDGREGLLDTRFKPPPAEVGKKNRKQKSGGSYKDECALAREVLHEKGGWGSFYGERRTVETLKLESKELTTDGTPNFDFCRELWGRGW